MRIFNIEAFDEIIVGTGNTWLTPASLNDELGKADGFAIHAITTNTSGTSPTMVITAQTSADGQNWVPYGSGSPEISTSIANNSSYYGSQLGISSIGLAYLRFQVVLGGTNPQCRLKLTVTGRSL